MATSPLHGGPYQLAYHGHRPRCRKLFDHLQYGVTAKANGLKIYEYLKDLLTEIPKHMDDSGLDFQDDLLPPGRRTCRRNDANKHKYNQWGSGKKPEPR